MTFDSRKKTVLCPRPQHSFLLCSSVQSAVYNLKFGEKYGVSTWYPRAWSLLESLQSPEREPRNFWGVRYAQQLRMKVT